MSLLPSATEIVFALGKGKHLVGRSHECDHPTMALTVPVCSRPRLDPAGSSQTIDADVRHLLKQGLSVFEVDPDALAAARPDIVLTQTQCEVCAVSPGDIEAALAQWTGRRPALVSLQPGTLSDLWQDIMRVAGALKAVPQGRKLLEEVKRRVDRTAGHNLGLTQSPKVACIEWIDPLMAAGNWIPELVEAAGGRDVLGKAGEHSPWLSWESLTAADPDIIVVMPCGFDLEKTCHESQQLKSHPLWSGLQAVRSDQVFAVDGHQYFNRPGPRLADSVDILKEIFSRWHESRFGGAPNIRTDTSANTASHPRYVAIT